MSGKIPSDPPKSSPVSQQEEEYQQSTLLPQLERSAIPPSLGQEKVDVEKMASLVKEEQKRKREETEEEEKGLELFQSSEKKRELEPESKEKIEILRRKVFECFGPLPQNLISLESIASFCFERIRERVRQPKYLKTEEIVKTYQLLFETELTSICESILSEPLNPIDPHPAYIFHTLNSCISRLTGNCRATRENYFSQHPTISNYFQKVPFGQRTQNLLNILEQQQPGFIEALRGAPVYTARELFGTNNVNPTYILHDNNKNPSWVFKPVTRKLTSEEKQIFQVPDNESGYQKYSSGDPQELSSRIEHAAYCLNFSKQFPIPFTFLVEVNGDIGSIQLFIGGQDIKIDDTILQEENFSKNLQAMLIFDLLFANCDRHLGNFLAKQLQLGSYHLYAIDHDACLQIGSGRPLKLQYLDYISGYSFRDDLKPIFSIEAIKEYKRIVEELQIPNTDQLNSWFDFVAEKLKNSVGEALRRLAEDIIKEYEMYF